MTEHDPAPEESEDVTEPAQRTPAIPSGPDLADIWSEAVDPDDGDYLMGTAMLRN